MSGILTVIKKIGEKDFERRGVPFFKHAVILEHLLADIAKDTPQPQKLS